MRYARTLSIAALACAGGALLGSQIDDPIRHWWLGMHGRGWDEHRVEVLDEFGFCPDYAFYGDSQVALGPWALAFGGRVGNLGLSGDTVGGVADRINRDCAAPVLLLVGVNDLRNGQSPEEISSAIAELLDAIEGQVFLIEVLPARDHFAGLSGGLQDLNTRLEAMCQQGCRWVPTWDVLADGEMLAEPYSWDGLHLNAQGYRVLANRVAQALSLPAPAQPAVADRP